MTSNYYFHLACRDEVIFDPDGIEISDLDHLQDEVIEALKEIGAERSVEAMDWSGWRLNVTDSNGTVVLSVALSQFLRA